MCTGEVVESKRVFNSYDYYAGASKSVCVYHFVKKEKILVDMSFPAMLDVSRFKLIFRSWLALFME